MRKIISIPRPAAPSASHSSGDEFTSIVVEQPDADGSAYVGRQKLYQCIPWFQSPRAVTCFLERHPEVETRHPMGKKGLRLNRLDVHVGGLMRALVDDMFSTDPALRKAMVRALQDRLKKESRRQ